MPLGGVNAADLNGVHLDGGPLLQVDHGLGIHDLAAFAVTLAIVFFRVFYVGIPPNVKGVQAVVAAGLVAAVVDAAARYNAYVAVFTDKEIVVDHLLHAGPGDNDGDMTGFTHGAVFDADVDTGFVLLAGDLNMLCGLAAVTAAVLADVKGPHGLAGQVRDFFQQYAVHFLFHHCPRTSFVSTGQPPNVSARIWGKISAAGPL